MTRMLADLTCLACGAAGERISENSGGAMYSVGKGKSRLFCEVYAAGKSDWDATARYIAGLGLALKQAHAFRFENVPFRNFGRRPVGDGIAYPPADPQAVALFDAGRLRLPFPVCWFEYVPPVCRIRDEATTSGFLVEERGPDRNWRIWHFDRHEDAEGTTMCFRCAGVELTRTLGRAGLDGFSSADADSETLPDVRSVVVDPLGHWERPGSCHVGTDRRRHLFALYLASALASRDKTLETVEPSKFENQRRSDRGLARLQPYARVVIGGGAS